MSVWIRIALYVVAGWLYGSGRIGEEVRSILTTDPEIAAGLELAISGLVTAIPLAWWRLAKRMGWST